MYPLQNRVYHLRNEFNSGEASFSVFQKLVLLLLLLLFSQTADPLQKGDENGNDKIASPESVSIHYKP